MEEEKTFSGEEQKTEDKKDFVEAKIYSKEEVLTKERIGGSIEKSLLLGKKTLFEILDLSENYQFEKPRKQIFVSSEGFENGWLDLSKQNFNFLIDVFGNRVGDIIGKKILVEGVPFKKEGLTEGITLKLYLPENK